MTTDNTTELLARWEARALNAAPVDSMIVNRHIRELREALAAAPAQPAEPDFFTVCAWHEGGGEAGWIAIPGYSSETEHGVKSLILDDAREEGYKGTITGRLMELGWEIRPVFLATPAQPDTHAQELTAYEITVGNLRAEIAALRCALAGTAPAPSKEYAELPEWSKMDNLNDMVPSEIRTALKTYADATHALRTGEKT